MGNFWRGVGLARVGSRARPTHLFFSSSLDHLPRGLCLEESTRRRLSIAPAETPLWVWGAVFVVFDWLFLPAVLGQSNIEHCESIRLTAPWKRTLGAFQSAIASVNEPGYFVSLTGLWSTAEILL